MSVTVIMPAYQSERVIRRAIGSALRQTKPPLEILVVDDGSTDGTGEAAASYGPLVRVLRQANAGAAAARNLAIREARGEHLAFLDADDEWLPGKLEAQSSHLDAHPEVALVATATRIVDEAGRTVLVAEEPGLIARRVLERMLYRNLVQTSSVMVRADAIRTLKGPFDPDQAPVEDWHLWIRVAARWPISVLPAILTVYHVLGSSLTRSTPVASFREAYSDLYASLESDEGAARLVRAHRRRLAANARMMVAHHMYARGDGWSARGEMLGAILRAPAAVKWSTALPILFLPRAVRDRLRGLRGGRAAAGGRG